MQIVKMNCIIKEQSQNVLIKKVCNMVMDGLGECPDSRGTQSRGKNHPRGMNKPGYSNPHKNYKGLNLIGKYEKQLTSRICQSINHFAKDCPDKKTTTSRAYVIAQGDITLIQQSGLAELTKQSYGLAILDSGCNTVARCLHGIIRGSR